METEATADIAGSTLRDSPDSGHTFPGTWFTDAAIFDLKQERVFHRSWLYVGFTSQIPDPGDYFTGRTGRVPVIVVRDEHGQINAFVNVCRHRGSLIVQEELGHRMTLQCPYHNWTYGLDGSLRNAPRSDRNPEFDPHGIALARLTSNVFNPLIFVSLDANTQPFAKIFAEWIEDVESTSARLDVALNCRESISHEIASNWKVLCENNFECYHGPANHPTLAAIQDVDEDFSYELCDRYFRYGPRPDTVHSIQNRDSLLYFLWPNLFIFFIPGVSGVVRQIQPVSSDRSLDVRHYCFSDAVDNDVKPETLEFWEHVLAQDAALCENVQRGLGSGRFGQGRLLLPVTDPAIQRFECMLHRSLSDGD